MILKSNKTFIHGINMKSFDLWATIAKFFSVVCVLLLPIKSALIAVSVLVLFDFITGVWASIREKKKITSSRLRRTVIKTLAYQSAIIVAFVMQTWLLIDMPVVSVVSGFIALTEGKSFFENLRRITGIDFWTMFIDKLNLPDTSKHDHNEK